jgi:hypothetical protein
MTIDMAWQSLTLEERYDIEELIRIRYLYPHTMMCRSCRPDTPCGAILPIYDILNAMVFNAR